MKIKYDKTDDALYIYFSKGKILKTTKLSLGLLVDMGAGGSIIGLEILDASARLGLKKDKNSGIEIPIAITA
jgi:uncharacterized protein YuzE